MNEERLRRLQELSPDDEIVSLNLDREQMRKEDGQSLDGAKRAIRSMLEGWEVDENGCSVDGLGVLYLQAKKKEYIITFQWSEQVGWDFFALRRDYATVYAEGKRGIADDSRIFIPTIQEAINIFLCMMKENP